MNSADEEGKEKKKMKNNENFNNLKHNIRDLNRNMTTTSRIVNNFLVTFPM